MVIDENVIFQNFIMFVCNLTSYPSENSNLNLLAIWKVMIKQKY